MSAEHLRRMKWIPVKNWKNLTATHKGVDGYLVSEEDVDIFVENLIREIARKLNLSYEEVDKVIKEENSAFFKLKAKVFKQGAQGRYFSSTLSSLKKALLIPDVNSKIVVNESKIFSEAEEVIASFYNLDYLGKIKVLEELSKISVRVEKCDD